MSDAKSQVLEHATPLRVYLGAGTALFILTALTVGIAQIHLGGWNAIVAIAIASIKALIVAFIFMHLLHDKRIFLVVFSTAIIFLGIFMSLTMFDVLSRGRINAITEKPIQEKAAMYEKLATDTTKAHESESPDQESTEH